MARRCSVPLQLSACFVSNSLSFKTKIKELKKKTTNWAFIILRSVWTKILIQFSQQLRKKVSPQTTKREPELELRIIKFLILPACYFKNPQTPKYQTILNTEALVPIKTQFQLHGFISTFPFSIIELSDCD